jgi:hypothetical protein
VFATIFPKWNGVLEMEALQHFSAMEAFCRQRAKMDGEDDRFWLTEADMLAKLAETIRSSLAEQFNSYSSQFVI